MFELLGGLFELILGLLDILNFASWIADFIAWIRSKPSRIERKDAKRRGLPIPPRSGSHIAFIILTVSSVILTVLLILKLTNII